MLFIRDPQALILIFVIVPILVWSFVVKNKVRLPYSKVRFLKQINSYNLLNILIYNLPLFLRIIILILLVLALSRPQLKLFNAKKLSEGLDMVLTIDTSGSMKALDFSINGQRSNRLEAIKWVIKNFIKHRPNDRIGLVVFGTESFTQAPLTLDHDLILQIIDMLKIGVAGDSTAIGDALITSINRIKDITAKSKIIILLTDGANNAGSVDPLIAAQIAKDKNIKVYTIGIGTDKEVPIPVDTPFGQQIFMQKLEFDEALLQKISSITDAQYFKAYNTEELSKIYDTIDSIEKTKLKIKDNSKYKDLYDIFLFGALVLIMFELFFNLTFLKRIP